ncbi:MAG: NUDIX domain-containing protein [Prevotellaceae bacterium]|jgi:mutator protein MutT|nr:NUDIX domain-containing protein [Prevotellaceae bacterium]
MIENFYPSNVWKHCPYCGSQHASWTGAHKVLCNACHKIFFINASAAVIALIRNDEGQMLFTRRKNDPAAGKLDLPGGFVNLGECAEDAVKREIREELGLELTGVRYFTSMPNRYLYDGTVYFTLDLVFVCESDRMDGISPNDDVSDFAFLDIKKVKQEDLGLESVIKLVRQLQNPLEL